MTTRTRAAALRAFATAALSLGSVALLAPTVASAQQMPHPQPQPNGGVPPVPQPPLPGDPPAFPDFNAVVKDMQATDGLLKLYRYKPDDATKDHTRLLAVIPKAQLGQDLLLATSISRGTMAGFQWNNFLVRFEQVGRQVLINVPDTRYVQTPGKPVTDSVIRTYRPTFLAAMPIVTMTPQGDPVVDLGPMLMGRTIPLPGATLGAEPRRDLSKYTKVKVFPENVLIDVDLALATRTGSGQTIGISYAFRKLPDLNSYQPRVADERVGYFTTVRQDWNIKHSERENLVRYVNRWPLEKKDPTLDVSPPKKPIVFIVEKTVPLQWRKYVVEGIAEWNKAFEKVGIQDAIVIHQQTDDNEFADIDPEDARYNFIRWIVTGNAFAMGPSRADPRTGQILDADIIFDDSMLRYYVQDFDLHSPGAISAIAGPELTKFLRENPSFLPAGHTLDNRADVTRDRWMQAAQAGLAVESDDAPVSNMPSAVRAHARCNYADGLRHQLAMMNLAITATASGKKIPDRFIGEAIREVIAHEVGHTLGLRHNFKASSWLSLEEVKRRRDTSDEPTVASVMDYNPLLFFAGDDPEKVRHFITPCIGPYDYWVIEYGYKVPGKDDGDEKAMLAKVAAKNTQRELLYATDEDTVGLSSPDPLVNRFDMSDDAVTWAKERVALCDSLLKDLKKWAVKKDEPAHYLRDVFGTLMYERSSNMMYVSRMVGGQQFNRNRPGDPEAKPALVLLAPRQQREALTMLGGTIFRDEFFTIDGELLNDLGPSRWDDWASDAAWRIDYPIHQAVLSMQSYTLMNLVSPTILQRVYDAELKAKAGAEDKFTAAELLGAVREMVWTELGTSLENGNRFTDAKPMIPSTRRNLQMQWLGYMIASADSKPGALMSPDLRNMVRFSLRELSEQIGRVMDKSKSEGAGNTGKLDFATRAHLTEVKSQIDRVLSAPHMTQQPGGGIIILGGGYGQATGEGQTQSR